MKRYLIFRKSSKFYWSNNKIVLSILSVAGIIIFVKSEILRIEKNEFDKYMMLLLCCALILGFLLKLYRVVKPDRLNGTLDGLLSFEPGKIVAGGEIYKVEEIAKITITNDDYYGKLIDRRSVFNSSLSNGVDNICEIALLDGRAVRYSYQLYYPNDLQKSKNELINYYKLGKLDLNNLADILSLSPSEVTEL